jgi:hypothetical protein
MIFESADRGFARLGGVAKGEVAVGERFEAVGVPTESFGVGLDPHDLMAVISELGKPLPEL